MSFTAPGPIVSVDTPWQTVQFPLEKYMLTVDTKFSVTEELQLYISRGLTDCFLLVLWVYVPEIFPTRVRNMAVGLINTTGKLGAVFGIVFVQVNCICYIKNQLSASWFPLTVKKHRISHIIIGNV